MLAELEDELAAGRSQRLVDAGEHAAQPVCSVHGEQPQAGRIVARAERRQSGGESLAAQDASLALVEHAKPRVDACRERVRAEQAVAEAVNRRDPGTVQLAS